MRRGIGWPTWLRWFIEEVKHRTAVGERETLRGLNFLIGKYERHGDRADRTANQNKLSSRAREIKFMELQQKECKILHDIVHHGAST